MLSNASLLQLQAIWPQLTNLEWFHSSSAGLEHLLFQELIESSVVLTNAKGVYSHSLAEYALTCCNYFAKDFPRMLAAKREHKWIPFDVEELRGKTMGIVGYGDIGHACARIARAFQMRVIALRRRTTLSEQEAKEGLVVSRGDVQTASSATAGGHARLTALLHLEQCISQRANML